MGLFLTVRRCSTRTCSVSEVYLFSNMCKYNQIYGCFCVECYFVTLNNSCVFVMERSLSFKIPSFPDLSYYCNIISGGSSFPAGTPDPTMHCGNAFVEGAQEKRARHSGKWSLSCRRVDAFLI
ncbi:hypothetical protein XENTR_v10008610 [Xenopus tropicalis]|nr:hypothetical protein XENTR_v10008610 [Xenopus tropicalis]